MGRSGLGVGFRWLMGLGFVLRAGAAHAQHTDGCPVATADYGSEIQRTFTDSKGRHAELFLNLPVGFDPSKPTGTLMYFHGNDVDPNDSYVAPLYEIQDRADAHGLIAAGLKSIGTRAFPDDGLVHREWVNADSVLLNELLSSDFGGCFKLDRSRVYLEGASQGTCFLAAALSNWLWRDFKGGVIGLCGCWGTGEYDYPVNVPAMRSGFKVFVENTTEDFLHEQGVMGMDTYKYNFGLDVRADLGRPGQHCADTRVNAAAALDWMTKGTSYADPDANQPHWQVVDMKHNGLEDIAYDPHGKRFVFAVERADVSADVLDHIEQIRTTMFVDDPQGFLDWRLANYPEYAVPPVLILSSSDYGATFTQLGRRESTGDENLRDMTVAPDGSVLVVAGLGIRKLNESSKMLEPFAFADKLVYALERDDAGNLFANGAVIKLQRSKDSGATWSALDVPVANRYEQWVVNDNGGYLTVIGSDTQVHFSQDAGDTFQAAALPTGTLIDFSNHGPSFYAVLSDQTLQVSTNAGGSWHAATVPDGVTRAVEVLANGDVLIATGAIAYDLGEAYRSKDAGQTWQRERGAHNDARLEVAFGEGDQAMLVTTRGIFRHSAGPLLDLGSPAAGGAGVGGQATGSGGLGAGGAAPNAASGNGMGGALGPGLGGSLGVGATSTSSSGSGNSYGNGSSNVYNGCGCRMPPGRSAGSAAALLLLAASAACTRRRRRTSAR